MKAPEQENEKCLLGHVQSAMNVPPRKSSQLFFKLLIFNDIHLNLLKKSIE